MENEVLDDLRNPEKGKKFNSLKELRAFFNKIKNQSQIRLEEGISKTEIFKEVINENGTRYSKNISKIVGFSITKLQESKYENVIRVLMILHFVSIVFQIIMGKNYYDQASNPFGLFFSFGFMILIDLIILRRLIKRSLQVLPLIISFGLLRGFGIINDFKEAYYGDWIYGYLIIIFFSIGIAYLLKRKLFNKLGFFGPKKDQNGNYIFE